MIRSKEIFATVAVLGLSVAAIAGPATAAAYLKFDGIKGEAQPAPEAPGDVKATGSEQKGLLLPAVQKVREAAKPSPKGGVSVATGDVNGDGLDNSQHIPRAKLFVRKQGTEQHDGAAHGGGMGAGKVNQHDLSAAPRNRTKPHVKVFDGRTGQ